MSRFTVEYTDTFNNEANYCWVKREDFTCTSKATRTAIIRKAKALVGLSNTRGVVTDYGDMIQFKPYKTNTIMFVYNKE